MGLSPAVDLQRRFFEMLMESQWWSPDAMRNYQATQLGQLLRHAKATTPFYGNRLDAVLGADSEVDWSRWIDIPIVTRADMSSQRAAMQASNLPPGHGPASVLETSGSTGLSISITVTSLVTFANATLGWRAHRWHDLDWSKAFCSRQFSNPGIGAYPQGTPLGPWGPPWESSSKGQTWALDRQVPLADVLEFVARRGCAYFNTGPKTSHALALESERLGLRDIRLDAFLTQGERCDVEDRAAIARAFGARVIELYSSKEAGYIALPCELGTRHINEETVLVEIVDQDGQACPEGQPGRVVVTPFFQTAQPLIRYEQGDVAEFGPPCACGRHSRTLRAILGRSYAIFRHPDGRAISRFMPNDGRVALNCSFWQIAQVGPLDFEIRYVPQSPEARADEEAFTSLFREIYFEDANVTFRRVASISPSKSGKYAEYVYEA
jgi:phenylacetate-CoA ligase